MLENAEVLGIKGDPKEKAHIYFRSGHVSSRRLTDCPQENGRQCRRQADRGGVCQGQIWTDISGCGKLYLKLRSKTSDRKTNGRLFFAWVSFIVCFRYTLRRFVVNYVFCAEILVVKTNCHLHVCSGGFLFSLLCGVIAWAWSRQHRASQPEGLVLRTVSGYWRLSHIVLIVLRPVSGFRWLTLDRLDCFLSTWDQYQGPEGWLILSWSSGLFWSTWDQYQGPDGWLILSWSSGSFW